MNSRHLPVTVTPDLAITVGGTSVRITPAAGLRLAETLIRTSTRAMIREEVQPATRLAQPQRKRVSR